MALQSYQIELKMHVGDAEHEAMMQVLKQTARDFLATAMLLSGGKGAMISARANDAFYDTQEIEYLLPSDTLDD